MREIFAPRMKDQEEATRNTLQSYSIRTNEISFKYEMSSYENIKLLHFETLIQ